MSIKQFLYHGKNGEIFFFYKQSDPNYYIAHQRATSDHERDEIPDNRDMCMGMLNLDLFEE